MYAFGFRSIIVGGIAFLQYSGIPISYDLKAKGGMKIDIERSLHDLATCKQLMEREEENMRMSKSMLLTLLVAGFLAVVLIAGGCMCFLLVEDCQLWLISSLHAPRGKIWGNNLCFILS